MRSAVWAGNWPVDQPWGRTDLVVEPYWKAAQCNWHCGIDIGMPSGTALHALRAGHLTARGTGYLGILTPSGETDWYLHGVYAPIGFGAFIAAGQRLGSSSNVAPSGGFVTGPHLHFEIQAPGGRLNNPSTSLNPVPALSGNFGAAGNQIIASPGGKREVIFYLDTDNQAIFAVYFDARLNRMAKYHVTPQEWTLLAPSNPVLTHVTSGPLQGVPDGSGYTPSGASVTAPAVDLSGVLAAIADLKAHPSFDPADAATLAIVQKLEAAMRAAGSAA